MAIDFTIYDNTKLVHATCFGLTSKDKLFEFQNSVWSAGQHAGYNCIFDMTKADICEIQYYDILECSRNAALLDYGHPPTKLAIVISNHQQKRLSEFYQAGVELSQSSTREMKIFFSLNEAKTWIL